MKAAPRKPCPIHPNKASFPTAVAATFAAGQLGKKHGHKLYPYRCMHCDRWHLSRSAEQSHDGTVNKRTA